jgi:hypothetical protein
MFPSLIILKMKNFYLLIVFLSFSIIVAAQKSEYRKACKLNNIDSYNEFLNTFPYSSDVEDVIDRVLKIQLSQITDDSIKTIVKSFCKIDEISKIALLKTEYSGLY